MAPKEAITEAQQGEVPDDLDQAAGRLASIQ
jgi:hypothetical protein